uniref:Pre-nudix hydrolase domain-containing protein n=1 Tax=Panagrolaimus sp. PS1159 TaxID=55785 RepID=A0AC35FUG6_9BILA
MNCFPFCEISLPKIGKSVIFSKLDVCKTPPVLTLSITSDGKRSVSSFVAGNRQQYRTIGNEYWPLQLQVKFQNAYEGGYYADGCIQTVRTGNTTWFMRGFIDDFSDSGCGNHRAHKSVNEFPIMNLLVILVACLVFVAVIAMFYRIYISRKSKNNQKTSYCIQKTVLQGDEDVFHGITIHSDKNAISKADALEVLKNSLKEWKANNVREVWFKVLNSDCFWISLLIENGFDFQHAESGFAMLTKMDFHI